MKETLAIIDADTQLEDSNGIIRLFCKDSEGKTVLVKDRNFQPYFFAMPKTGKIAKLKREIEKLNEEKIGVKILKVEVVEKTFHGEPKKLLKIITDNPRKVPDIKDIIKHWPDVEDVYEYDITFYKRYLIDKQIEPTGWVEVTGGIEKNKEELLVDRVIDASEVKPSFLEKSLKFSLLAFDTEWIEEKGTSKLIMLSMSGEGGFKKVITSYEWKEKPNYVEVVSNEKEIIEKFLEHLKKEDPDFLIGYASDAFDIPKLKSLALSYKIPLKLGRDDATVYVVRRGRISSSRTRGRVHIDIFNFVDHVLSASMRSEVLTLDEVARQLLGIGKKEMSYKSMVEIWTKKKDVERLAEYSLRDSELTLKLAEYILPQVFALSKLTGQIPFDASRYTYSQLVESFFM